MTPYPRTDHPRKELADQGPRETARNENHPTYLRTATFRIMPATFEAPLPIPMTILTSVSSGESYPGSILSTLQASTLMLLPEGRCSGRLSLGDVVRVRKFYGA